MPQINHFIILFYQDQNGNTPAEAFLLGLNKPLLAKFTSTSSVPQINLAKIYRKDYIERPVAIQTFDKFLTNQQKDPDFLRKYQWLEPERSIMRTLLDARMEQNLTQKELAEKISISQTNISKLEKGTRNPPLKLLQCLADGLDLDLKMEFLPREKESIGDRK